MTLIIAEAGTCDNDLTYAHHAADAIHRSGAWAMKTQLLHPDRITDRQAATYSRGLKTPATQHEAFTGALPHHAWAEVKAHCDDLNLEWFASCWDHQAVDACMNMGVNWFKIGSADITYESLLRHIGETGIPVILSTGGAELDEIARAIGWIGHYDIVPMVCTLAYPCPPEQAHLNRLKWWQTQGWQVGYSDHTTGLDTMIVAAMLGASHVEKHFTLTPGAGGDHDFGITPDQLEWVVDRVGSVGVSDAAFLRGVALLGDRRIRRLEVERQAVAGARRSWHTGTPVAEGELFGPFGGPVALRPGTGIEPTGANWDALCGARAKRDYAAGELIDPTELG